MPLQMSHAVAEVARWIRAPEIAAARAGPVPCPSARRIAFVAVAAIWLPVLVGALA